MAVTAGYEITWAARQYGDRVAVKFDDQSLSFDEVNRRGNRLANTLIELGLNQNHRVGVILNNSLETLDIVVGVAKAGVSHLALNARYPAAEHRKVLEDAEPTIIIAGPEFTDVIQEAVKGLDCVKAVYGIESSDSGQINILDLRPAADDKEPKVKVELNDTMRLHYTSGTTGKPKGIIVTYQNYYARLNNFYTALDYGLGVSDSMLHVGPLTHAAGNYLMPFLIRGACNVIMPRFEPIEMQAIIERKRITTLLLVPTMLIRLLEDLDLERFDLSSIKRIYYGTAPMPIDVLRRGIKAFGPIFYEHYGLSECAQPATMLYPHEHVLEGPEEKVRRLASCG